MQNPILGGSRIVIRYFLIWLFFSVLFFGLLAFFMTTERKYLAADILIQNLVMASIMIGLWYPIHFMTWENQKLRHLMLNHVLLFCIFAFSWVSITHFLLRLIFNKEPINEYLKTAIVYKIPFCFFAYIVFVISNYLLKYYTSFVEKKEIESRLNDTLKEAELTLLRNQMNPHFIFNSLNSISSLTILDPEKAHEMVIKLSDFLRYTVGYGQKQKVSLQKEIEMCQAYLDIEKIRFGDKIQVEFEFAKDTETVEVPSMLLQTLFENAIKHGIYNSLKPETIFFKANLEENRLILLIENTFDADGTQPIGTKTGIKNIKERLRMLYQNLAIFKTEVIDNKFKVSINIPLET